MEIMERILIVFPRLLELHYLSNQAFQLSPQVHSSFRLLPFPSYSHKLMSIMFKGGNQETLTKARKS